MISSDLMMDRRARSASRLPIVQGPESGYNFAMDATTALNCSSASLEYPASSPAHSGTASPINPGLGYNNYPQYPRSPVHQRMQHQPRQYSPSEQQNVAPQQPGYFTPPPKRSGASFYWTARVYSIITSFSFKILKHRLLQLFAHWFKSPCAW